MVDDSCPIVHVYRRHQEDVNGKRAVTKDGRPLLDTIPNEFLNRFCNLAEKYNMAGKLSIVPAPGGMGDIVKGITGFDYGMVSEWIDTAKTRLGKRFDFTPECISHNLTLNLETGEYMNVGEAAWSMTQTRETLVPYIAKALDLLKEAGIDATGVTSPWDFGIKVEEEYIAAIVEAQRQVYGRKFSWYFLHMQSEKPDPRPWVAYDKENAVLVSIPGASDDYLWETIDSPRTDLEFMRYIADKYITDDGCNGRIATVIENGGWPVLVTHWQSLFSNGLETGLKILDIVGERIERHLGSKVEWNSCMELARKII
jgi:hypothetical protein